MIITLLMDIQKIKDFWVEEADEALQVAWHLFEKKDFSYALFFGHLAVEKILKAVFVIRIGEHPPHIHNLQRLAEIAGIELSEVQIEQLIKISSFNLKARYPDQKRDFRKKCTEEFTKNELEQIEEIIRCLRLMLQ